ncbi:POZ [Glarea lozoyensis ATCC 20868]|uniref:POZ n=1 Tax=Glarea lozoyensis (strain ATCC 20868 / MF5171) TaxID=1116229 RepID=S3CZM7_GLAL2|nr:POZ [Glarea lozoyensis ATCC 20868]EPE31712.1 POZ [Glarea lozoyensis ATCC 20868]
MSPPTDASSDIDSSKKRKHPHDEEFPKILGTEMLNIYVGKEKRHFRVHKKILCQKIEYFDQMFNGKFCEALKSTASFPENDPVSFDVLIDNCQHYVLSALRKAYVSEKWKTKDILKAMASNEDLGTDVLNLIRAQKPGTSPQDPRELCPCTYHIGQSTPCSDFFLTRPNNICTICSPVERSLKMSGDHGGKSSTESSSASSWKFLDKFGTTMVDIYIGEEKTHFRVHKSILCTKIEYFERMFNSSFAESSGFASFPEDDPTCFDVLLEWVYSGSLRNLAPGDKSKPRLWNPYQLFSLVDRMMIQGLKDGIMDAWISHDKADDALPGIHDATEIYAKTPAGSGPRKYMAYALHYVLTVMREQHARTDWSTADIAKALALNEDLCVDVLELIRSQRPNTSPKNPHLLCPCTFHSEKHSKCDPEILPKKKARKSGFGMDF